MNTETTQMILQIILSVLGILIPFGVKYAIDHVGKDKLTEALKIAKLAQQFIIGYFELNPTAEKDIKNIIAMFKSRLALTIKLTPAEIDYLWSQISADVLKALNIELKPEDAKVSLFIKSDNEKQELLFK